MRLNLFDINTHFQDIERIMKKITDYSRI